MLSGHNWYNFLASLFLLKDQIFLLLFFFLKGQKKCYRFVDLVSQIRWSGFLAVIKKPSLVRERGGTIILTFDARGRDFLQFSIAHEMKEERNKGTFLKTSLRIQRWNWFGKKIRQSLPQGNFSCLLLLIQK